LTFTGNLPNSYGNRSSTLARAKDPPAINRMLSVFKCFPLSELVVGNIVPYNNGRKSL
jgi:hypothetical protein